MVAGPHKEASRDLFSLSKREGVKMMEKFRVANTNANSYQKSVVRVYDASNKMIAEQFINKNNPLGYIKEKTRSKHKRSLCEQCIKGGMTADEFTTIFGECK